jgi:hypothetical protein
VSARRRVRGRESTLAFEALSIEGGLLSPDWLSRLAQLQAGLQSESDYRVLKGLNLRDEIGRYWRVAQAHARDFETGLARRADADALARTFVTALLREVFGFTSLAPTDALVRDGRSFPLGHVALGGKVPVVIAPADSGLDTLAPRFGDDGKRRSAFGLVQEFLNATDEALWGLASDGTTLRILRDNASLTRPAWIEADLARIFREERYADFAALWLLVHESRFGTPTSTPSECPLESWRTAGREEGTRAREHLRRGVEAALKDLGEGFLSHPDNGALRAALEKGELTLDGYFQQLLRLCYRLIFLLTAEEREVLHPPAADAAAKGRYAAGYSLRRLRERSTRRSAHDRFSDLWEGLRIVLRGLARGAPKLALPALGGLFAEAQCPHLDAAKIENRFLLAGVFHLSWLREESGISRVNWRDMGPEELGSVYESLLELVPQIADGGRSFGFVTPDIVRLHARRGLGAYYTPEDLVGALLDRALAPVIRDTIAAHPASPAEALLSLTIIDPACGSGHFLLAAARRLAAQVARLEANGTPSAAQYRHALREVVARCIYGVDLNPMALELCRVSLWMEAVEPGLPLSFLDSHLQHGNSLLGATPELLAKGIPDAAWEPIEGDDRKVASALKKRNKQSGQGQGTLAAFWYASPTDDGTEVTRAVEALDRTAEDDLDAVIGKARTWEEIRASAAYRHQKFVADAWCAAFMWPKVAGPDAEAAPTNDLWLQIRDQKGATSQRTRGTVEQLAARYHFFHWHLAFPRVFRNGGFDVVIGNPPWIAHAGRASQPLPAGVRNFYEATAEAFADYPTTHGIFVSVLPRVLRRGGRQGLVIPSSLSELGGYEPTRRAHDRLCAFPEDLVDFGEGRFPGVTQPCMALVSQRTAGGRADAEFGEPWPMERPDLSAADRELMARLASFERLPASFFGERGLQSDKSLAVHFVESNAPVDRFNTAVREGTDVREFELLPPRNFVDRTALAHRLRSPEEFAAVQFVVRQTARYPIAAANDGVAFRNSLLAGFGSEAWPAEALVALLNSALIRWIHYMRFRDARQPAMPQVKIGHLRAIPAPRAWTRRDADELSMITTRFTQGSQLDRDDLRDELDRRVSLIYELDREESMLVARWHSTMGPRRRASEG